MIFDDRVTLKILLKLFYIPHFNQSKSPVEYRLIACLPKALPIFSPFRFSLRCLYSAYVLLIILFVAFLCAFVLCCCLLHPLKVFVCHAVQHLLLVYQPYLQRNHHCFIYFLYQPSSLSHPEITTIER